jgi:CBS domain-containing protein
MATIGDRMTGPVISIGQDASIKSATEKIYAHAIGSLLVTHDEKFVGIITKTDSMLKVLIKNLDADSTPVSDVISEALITIDVGETLDSAKKLLDEKSFRHLPVTRDNEIIGILSPKDLR